MPDVDNCEYSRWPIGTILRTTPNFAGNFGERRIWVEAGPLIVQRDGRPRVILSALAANLFGVDQAPMPASGFVEARAGSSAMTI